MRRPLEHTSHVHHRQQSRLSPHRPPPRIEDRARKLLVRQDRRRASWNAAASEPRTGRVSMRSASPTSRATISRSMTMCSTRASWSARSRRSTAGTAATCPLDTYFAMARGTQATPDMRARHAHAGAWRSGARDDQMVRHQLPLHGAGARARPGASPSPRPSRSMNSARRRRSAIHTRPVLLGPVTYLAAGKSKDGDVRSAVAAARPAAGLCRVLRRLARRARTGCRSTSRAWCSTSPTARRRALRTAYRQLARAAAPI